MTTPPLTQNQPQEVLASIQTPWTIFGQVNTTKTGLQPAVALVQDSGEPATSVMGSGSGQTDRYIINPGRSIAAQLQFFGSGLATSWMQANVIERRQEMQLSGAGTFWDRRILASVRGQLGTKVGVAGAPIGATQRFVSNLEVVADYTPGSGVRVNSDGGVATLVLDIQGGTRLEVDEAVGMGSGSGAVAVNGRWAGL